MHNKNAAWIDDIKEANRDILQQSEAEKTIEDVQTKVKKISNWKSLGPDQDTRSNEAV